MKEALLRVLAAAAAALLVYAVTTLTTPLGTPWRVGITTAMFVLVLIAALLLGRSRGNSETRGPRILTDIQGGSVSIDNVRVPPPDQGEILSKIRAKDAVTIRDVKSTEK